MTNVQYAMEDYRDIETLNVYKERREQGYTEQELMRSIHAKSRDNARTPMHWSADANAGFTTGTPWIKVNPNYVTVNAADQVGRADSVFTYYKTLIALRKAHPVFVDGNFTMLAADHPQVFAYARNTAEEELVVVCNFYGETLPCPVERDWSGYELLLTNESDPADPAVLRPYEARMYLRKK